MQNIRNYIERQAVFFFVLCLVFLIGLGCLGYFYYNLRELNLFNEKTISNLNGKIDGLSADLASTTAALSREQEINSTFAGQIDDIQGEVSKLDKLFKTDPELLRKYSQVFFLSDNYVPASLTKIDSKYLAAGQRDEKIHEGVWPHLEKMLRRSDSDDVPLKVVSAYRSFAEQRSLKSNYTVVYGTGANQFSADQGYSEHQLGTTVDLAADEKTPDIAKFEASEAYQWMRKNAHRYGFILSYPKGNGYYEFEPWHWRFVGVKLATKLYSEDKYFYSFSQREINEYLAEIFD